MASPSSAIISCRVGSNNVRSEDFAVRFANNYLNEAFAFANGTSPCWR